jgi:hypothetical protein
MRLVTVLQRRAGCKWHSQAIPLSTLEAICFADMNHFVWTGPMASFPEINTTIVLMALRTALHRAYH